MSLNRRDFVISSSALALFCTHSTASAQTKEGADSYRNTFGMPNYVNPTEGLKFLKRAQENRLNVPRDLNRFTTYIENLPTIGRLRDAATPNADVNLILLGLSPELYHLVQWNAFALDLTAIDHTTIAAPAGSPPDPLFAEQIGPHRSSRALAIVHLAMYEAINVIYRRSPSHKMLQDKIAATLPSPVADYNPLNTSVRAAIAYSASTTLKILYPNKTIYTEIFMRTLMPLIGDTPDMVTRGVTVGSAAAAEVLRYRDYDPATKRFSDGSETADGTTLLPLPAIRSNALDFEPEAAVLFPDPKTFEWRSDPLTSNKKAIGGYWHFVKPFTLDPADLFLPPGPPAEGSTRFEESYRDVRLKGGDPNPVPLGLRRKTFTTRTGTRPTDPPSETNETFKGQYWAYDATALLCAPPRLYNMIATSIALNEHPITEVAEFSRYLALVNLTLADAAIGAWTAKYKFKFARPVTYFRYHRPGDTTDTIDNKYWTPLGAPTSNGAPEGANMTPPFPAYPSGHAVFGGALFGFLRAYFKFNTPSEEKFEFVSDEYNGVNRGPTGEARPYYKRTIPNFMTAAQENARSRIFLGIHWSFDGDDGIKQGEDIASYVMSKTLKV